VGVGPPEQLLIILKKYMVRYEFSNTI